MLLQQQDRVIVQLFTIRKSSQSRPLINQLFFIQIIIILKAQITFLQYNMSEKQPKSINTRVAQRICETLRNQNTEDFFRFAQNLLAWQRKEKQNTLECHQEIQEIIKKYPNIIKDLNEFLYKSYNFKGQKTLNEKLSEFMRHIKSASGNNLDKVLTLLATLQKETEKKEVQDDKFDEKLIKSLYDLFKDNPQITQMLDTIWNHPQIKQSTKIIEKEIPKKIVQKPYQPEEDDKSVKQKIEKKKEKEKEKEKQKQHKSIVIEPIEKKQIISRKKQFNIITPVNQIPPEEHYFMETIRNSTEIFKLIHLYQLCIINKTQIIAMISQDNFNCPEDYDYFREIIQSRQLVRLKAINAFKPLNQIDFSRSQRAGHSYVEIPFSYKSKPKVEVQSNASLLNNKWVLVPHYSNFNIAQKNQHELNLIKSQDEKYEFDLYTYRLRKSEKILNRIINQELQEKELDSLINTLVRLGVLEHIYKNCQKDQKEQLEIDMKSSQINTCKIFRDRVTEQLKQLKNIKQIHGVKIWHEVAQKNFYKSLDKRSFYFKNNEKEYSKAGFFENQLEEKLKELNSVKEKSQIFQQKPTFFNILNTYENLSKYERCESHKYNPDELVQYNVSDYSMKASLPLVTLIFGNQQVCEVVYSMLGFYANNFINSENEKLKIKVFLNSIATNIFNWKRKNLSLSDAFSQEEFYRLINQNKNVQNNLEYIMNNYLIQQTQEQQKEISEPKDIPSRFKQMKVTSDGTSEFDFLPQKKPTDLVFFGSVFHYTTFRLLFILYQRFLKAFEIIQASSDNQNYKKNQLQKFKILLMICIKSKQSSKFQENLSYIFGKTGYIFSTIYKLMEITIKSIQSCLGDPLTAKLLEQFITNKKYIDREDFYLHIVNKIAYNINSNSKIIRFCITKEDKLVFINLFHSYYRGIQNNKESKQKSFQNKLEKLREERQLFVIKTVASEYQRETKNGKKKEMDKKNESKKLFNENEYHSLASNRKLSSRVGKQDLLYNISKKKYTGKILKRQIKKLCKIEQFINEHLQD